MFTGLWVVVCSAGTDLAELFASPEELAEEAIIEAAREELEVDDSGMVLLWPTL